MKHDFVILNDFFKEAQISEADIAEINTYDTQDPSIEDRNNPLLNAQEISTDFEPSESGEAIKQNRGTVLDVSEIRVMLENETFRRAMQFGALHETPIPGFSDTYSLLADFIQEHLAQDYFATLCGTEGFPILPDVALTDDPAQNLQAFLDFVMKAKDEFFNCVNIKSPNNSFLEMTSVSGEPLYSFRAIHQRDRFNNITNTSYTVALNFGIFRLESTQNNITDPKQYTLWSFVPQGDPLFWDMIDPKNTIPDLATLFLNGLDTHGQQPFPTFEDTISGITNFDLSAVIPAPVPVVPFSIPTDKRSEFETYLTEHNGALDETCVAYFTADDATVSAIKYNKELSEFEITYHDGRNERFAASIVWAQNGYNIQGTEDKDWGYVYKLVSVWDKHQGQVVTFPLNGMPAFVDSASVLKKTILDDDSLFDQPNYPGHLFSHYGAFAVRGWADELKTLPWLYPLLETYDISILENELALFMDDLGIYAYLFNQPSIQFQTGGNRELDLICAMIAALKKSNHPQIGLAALLYMAVQNTQYGSHLRDLLPYVLSEIHYYEDQGAGEIQRWRVDVDTGHNALGNAWLKWKPEYFYKAAYTIATLSGPELEVNIDKIDSDYFKNGMEAIERDFEFDIVSTSAVPQKLYSDSLPQINDALDFESFVSCIKLPVTRRKLEGMMQEKQGFLRLGDILNTIWSNTESEDIRRAFKRFVKIYPETFLNAFTGMEEYCFSSRSIQFELLPERVLEQAVLLNRAVAATALEWLFYNNENAGIKTFEKYLATYGHLPQKNTSSLVFDKGFSLMLASLNPKAVKLLKEKETVFTGASTEDNFSFDPQTLQAIQDKLHFQYDAKSLETLIQVYQKDYQKYSEHKDSPEFKILFFNLCDDVLAQWFFLSGGKLIWTDEMAVLLSSVTDESLVVCLKAKYFELEETDPNPKDILLNGLSYMKQAFEQYQNREYRDQRNFPKINEKQIMDALSSFLNACPQLKQDQDIWNFVFEILDIRIKSEQERFNPAIGASFSDLNEIFGDFVTGVDIPKEVMVPPEYKILSLYFGQNNYLNEVFHLKENVDGMAFVTVNPEFSDLWYMFDSGTMNLDQGLMEIYGRLWNQYGPFKLVMPELSFSNDKSEKDKEYSKNYLLPDYQVFMASQGMWDEVRWGVSGVIVDWKNPLFTKILIAYKRALDAGSLPEAVAAQDFFQKIHRLDDLLPSLETLSHFVDYKIPKTISERDPYNLDIDELSAFLKAMGKIMEVIIGGIEDALYIGANGYEITSKNPEALQLIKNLHPGDSVIGYLFTLVQAILGDEVAVQTLWKYHYGDLKLESDVKFLGPQVEKLLFYGEEFLKHHNPAQYFGFKTSFADTDKNHIATVEMGIPDIKLKSLKDHVVLSKVAREAQVDSHSTFTTEVSLGGSVWNGDYHGIVRSYVVSSYDRHIFYEVDSILSQVLADLRAGKKIDVVSISMGSFFIDAGIDTESFLSLPVARSIRSKLAMLQLYKVPLVVAAGNEGSYEQSLAAFNDLGKLGNNVIVVGSSTGKKLYESQYLGAANAGYVSRTSEFSSQGNHSDRTDVVSQGEGIDVYAGGLFEMADGTSFSTPAVAALLATMKGLGPSLTVEMLKAILKMTAQDLSGDDTQKEGAGEVQVRDALYMAAIMDPFMTRKKRDAIGQEFGYSEERAAELIWLSRRIRSQVWLSNTNYQGYGE